MTRSSVDLQASDAELVSRALRGDRNAYGALVTRHQQYLYRHARGMSFDHDTSLDLVQDAFVKAYLRLRDCRDPGRFRAWVFRIARNLYLDHLRNVRNTTLSLSSVDGVDAMALVPGDLEVTAILHAALGCLPVPMREAFLLKHDAGYTYDEIAELTDASASAVKMRVHRAREALRAFLEERGVLAA